MFLFSLAEQFAKPFIKHARKLLSDPHYLKEFQSTVRAMDLGDWYATETWRQSTKYLLLLRPYCVKCGRRDHLQCHHLRYNHLGLEILFPDDLVTLCDQCHLEIHGGTLPQGPKWLQMQLPLWFRIQHTDWMYKASTEDYNCGESWSSGTLQYGLWPETSTLITSAS